MPVVGVLVVADVVEVVGVVVTLFVGGGLSSDGMYASAAHGVGVSGDVGVDGVVDGGSIGGNGVVGGVVVEGGDFCFVCVLAFVGTRAPAAQVVFVVIGGVGGGCGGVVHFNFCGVVVVGELSDVGGVIM